jgi:hypothetical protein
MAALRKGRVRLSGLMSSRSSVVYDSTLLFSDLACCVSRKFWVIRVGMSSSVSLDMLAILMRFFFGAACFFSVAK